MARVDPEALAAREPARIYIAATMKEARSAEALLTRHGVEYAVSVEAFGRTLFGSPRNGAVFTVAAGQADWCANLLIDAGLGAGVVPEDAPRD